METAQSTVGAGGPLAAPTHDRANCGDKWDGRALLIPPWCSSPCGAEMALGSVSIPLSQFFAFPAGSDSRHGQALGMVATRVFSLATGISSPEWHTACPMVLSSVGRDRAHPQCTLRGVRERGYPWG